MAQIFDKSRGCLPVTAYLILVSEDTTVTVGDGACTVTITADEGQRVVWTDSTAKLTLSTDSARYEQLPKSAPLPIGTTGQGGTPLSPEEQAALMNLVGGALEKYGIKLSLEQQARGEDIIPVLAVSGALELLLGGGKVNTQDAVIYHGGGSATFSKTEGGHTYAAAIDYKHFEVRRDGELIVYIHADGNGHAVIEINGSRVLTEEGERVETAEQTSVVDYRVDIQHGTWVEIPSDAQSVELVPAEGNYGRSMTLAFTPSDSERTAPLFFADGVEVHWRADDEPNWEAGKTYTIELKQLAQGRIELKLYQEENMISFKEFYKTVSGADPVPPSMGTYVCWGMRGGVRVPLAAQVGLAETINYMFCGMNDNGASTITDVRDLAGMLQSETFGSVKSAKNAFAWTTAGANFSLHLPEATFDELRYGDNMFYMRNDYAHYCESIFLPKATFRNQVDDVTIAGCLECILPKATFENVNGNNALNIQQCPNSFFDWPLATFERAKKYNNSNYLGNVQDIHHLPSLNLRRTTQFSHANHILDFEFLMTVVYGPKVNATGQKDLENGKWKIDDNVHPTGWGIRDFRLVHRDGTFITTAGGGWEYETTVPTAATPIIDTNARDNTTDEAPVWSDTPMTVAQAVTRALEDWRKRGWTISPTYQTRTRYYSPRHIEV